MASISYKDKQVLEELFEMKSGYVLDFTNNSFAEFVGEITNIDIYTGLGYQDYCSKASKLRQIWANEPDNVVGNLTEELLDHCEDYYLKKNDLSDYRKKKIAEMRIMVSKLKGNTPQITLPKEKEETLQTLLEDINSALARNKPELVLDRLHTFSTKLLRQTCLDNGISIKDNSGNYYPLHSLAGMLQKKYDQDDLFQSTFTSKAMHNCISLFDSFNEVRNTQSFAHDNEILDSTEAEFVVRIMSDVITFIDKAEKIRKQKHSQNLETSNNGFPF